MKILTRRTVVISFLLSAIFGIFLVIQGLLVQAPISKFQDQPESGLNPELDAQIASTSWHPQWFRARVFSLPEEVSIDIDLDRQLHLMWLYMPSLELRDRDISSLLDMVPKDKVLLLEIVEEVFLAEEKELYFSIQSSHINQLLIDGVTHSSDTVHKLSKGRHRISIRVIYKDGPFDLSVALLDESYTPKPFYARQHLAYTQRFGENRTSYELPIKSLFEEGKAELLTTATPYLEDIWFGINEGRFLGRIVIEVHNKDGAITLSQKRALKIARELVKRGTPSKIITVQGYGAHWLEDKEGHLSIILLH